MAEVIDKYMSFDDRIPAPERHASTPQEETPNFFIRLVDTVNKNLANQGDPIAQGLRSMFSEDYYNQMRQREARAARFAELQLQEAEQRVLNRNIANDTAAFNLEQARNLAPLELEGRKLQNQSAAFNLEQARNLAPLELEGRKLQNQSAAFNLEQARNLAPLHRQQKEAEVRRQEHANNLQLFKLQEGYWKAYQRDYALADARMKKQIGWDLMNDTGRAIIENSPYYKAMIQSNIMFHSLKNNPEQANYYFKKMGWTLSKNENGEDVLISSDGTKKFVATEDGVRNFMKSMQENFMGDVTAANIKGTQAKNLAMGAVKTYLNSPHILSVFGTEGAALQAYEHIYNKKRVNSEGVITDAFTPTQKMIHVASVSLNAALADNIFTNDEIEGLTPAFLAVVKQQGGEVSWGKDVDSTIVRIRSNGQCVDYPIREYAKRLRAEDVITPFIEQYVSNVAAKKKKLTSDNTTPGQTPGNTTPRTEKERAIVQIFGEPPEGVTIPTHGELGENYRAVYRDLSNEKKLTLATAYTDWMGKYIWEIKDGKIQTKNIEAMPQKERLTFLRQADAAWRQIVEDLDLPEELYSPVAQMLHDETAKALDDEMASLWDKIWKKYPKWAKAFAEEYNKGNRDIDKFIEKYVGPATKGYKTGNLGRPTGVPNPEFVDFKKNLLPMLKEYLKLMKQYDNHNNAYGAIEQLKRNGLGGD